MHFDGTRLLRQCLLEGRLNHLEGADHGVCCRLKVLGRWREGDLLFSQGLCALATVVDAVRYVSERLKISLELIIVFVGVLICYV